MHSSGRSPSHCARSNPVARPRVITRYKAMGATLWRQVGLKAAMTPPSEEQLDWTQVEYGKMATCP
jgi:hypothetical protein